MLYAKLAYTVLETADSATGDIRRAITVTDTTKKGTKELCDALKFIYASNMAIADEAIKANNFDEAADANNAADAAVKDMEKWGCRKSTTSRARKDLARLKAAVARSRRSGRSSKKKGRRKGRP